MPPPPDFCTTEQPHISFHAMVGQSNPKTLCLKGKIQNQNITILIVGGSTHNFLQVRVAKF